MPNLPYRGRRGIPVIEVTPYHHNYDCHKINFTGGLGDYRVSGSMVL